ncbi:hypothetical protein CARUB_v10002772mg [Capsella rubella]|uniref:Uncharacterized protein n=1 Tax=Capsella rubella TaxID=81985 RepID=R0HB12_9BRAS|nr:hypothetical protein CARUB_v10002772mg [Capsella rubella]
MTESSRAPLSSEHALFPQARSAPLFPYQKNQFPQYSQLAPCTIQHNSNEIAAASPYFHPSSDGKLQNFAVPIPQAPWRRNQASSGSNITPTTEYEINSRVSRKFEVGECSRRHEEGETVKSNEMEESQKRKISEVRKNEAVQTKQKQKVQEHSKGGILKPPKKR